MAYRRKISSSDVGETDAETARNAGVSKSAVSQSRVRSKTGRESMEDAILRKERALADLRETEAALAMGNAISIDSYKASLAAMIGTARAKLLGLGSRVAKEVAKLTDPSSCKDIIDSAVREALAELSTERVPDIPNFDGEPGNGKPQTHEPVGAAA